MRRRTSRSGRGGERGPIARNGSKSTSAVSLDTCQVALDTCPVIVSAAVLAPASPPRGLVLAVELGAWTMERIAPTHPTRRNLSLVRCGFSPGGPFRAGTLASQPDLIHLTMGCPNCLKESEMGVQPDVLPPRELRHE